jgi:hypothetical protein
MSGSTALTVLSQVDKLETAFFAGDPATTFHELWRFLFMHGVDTKLYSGSKVPSRFSGKSTNLSMEEVFSIDNAFFSEFRSMIAVETAQKRVVLNTLIFVLRVFFKAEGDGNSGTIQIILNHLHDGIHEVNDIYSSLCEFLVGNRWEQHSRPPNRLSLTSNMVFNHPFSGVHEFTSMYWKLEPILMKHGIVGSHLPIESPF